MENNEISPEDRLRLELIEGLPHLFGFKWYSWAREFFESRNRTNLLCAGNQISKSSTQIRKCIDWATDTDKWKELWPHQTPNQFWYLYPSQKVVEAEWLTKWSQFLPRGRFKHDKKYGWKPMKKNSDIIGVQFNSGITMLFKTYSQKIIDLQSGSVHAMFADEELPVDIYDELMFRLTATRGYFHMVFTATIGQDFWRKALEPEFPEEETLVGAWKREVSLFDAMEYEDGTASPWTKEEIQRVINRCSTDEEVQRRVYGKFITSLDGRKYPAFDSKRHYIPKHSIPHDWLIYSGVDIGSGGDGHPSAISFVAVDPTYSEGRLFLGWRGDEIGNTTAADVMDKYRAMKDASDLRLERQFYDQGCRDFRTISERIHEPFEAAEKGHDIGDDIINLLFKYDMIKVFEGDTELSKFGREIVTIKKATPKNKRKDDFVDSFRYAVTQIPWNLDFIKDAHIKRPEIVVKEKSLDELSKEERQTRAEDFKTRRYSKEADDEFRELNELYEGF